MHASRRIAVSPAARNDSSIYIHFLLLGTSVSGRKGDVWYEKGGGGSPAAALRFVQEREAGHRGEEGVGIMREVR